MFTHNYINKENDIMKAFDSQEKEETKKEKHGTGKGAGRLVLHRKWRSGGFDEIVGQEHVVRTLRNALSLGRVAPAYLFSGPRGTGKTSMARILAKALNCPNVRHGEPCNKCRICRDISAGTFLDVIEMDAASHTQVDKIREFIVEKVNFRPVEGKRKVYIIDEVHKLSSYSFDALLKTIEEPPPFVVFILATTEPEKLPPTIISRCQRYDFKRIPVKQIIDRLCYISEKEKFSIEDGALNLIAQSSDGALRDALVILEQAVSFTEGCITAGEVISMLGMTQSEVLFSFADIILNNDARRGLQYIDDIYREGKDLQRLTQDLLEHFRKLLIIRMVRDAESILEIPDSLYNRLSGQAFNFKPNHLLHIIKQLMELRQTMREVGMERILWESAIVKLTRWELSPTVEGLNRRIEELEKRIAGTSTEELGKIRVEHVQSAKPEKEFRIPAAPPEIRKPEPRPPGAAHPAISTRVPASSKELPEEDKGPKALSSPGPSINDAALWHRLLREVKRENLMLMPVLKEEGAGTLEGDKYILNMSGKNPFNRDLLDKNRNYIENVLEKITGKKISLALRAGTGEEDLFKTSEKPHNVFVQEVMDMFGASPVDKPL